MVATVSRSCRLVILLVAWRRSATGSSSGGMPRPSSSTAIRRTPPASSRTVICVAPASSALSTSSRTTEAGARPFASGNLADEFVGQVADPGGACRAGDASGAETSGGLGWVHPSDFRRRPHGDLVRGWG